MPRFRCIHGTLSVREQSDMHRNHTPRRSRDGNVLIDGGKRYRLRRCERVRSTINESDVHKRWSVELPRGNATPQTLTGTGKVLMPQATINAVLFQGGTHDPLAQDICRTRATERGRHYHTARRNLSFGKRCRTNSVGCGTNPPATESIKTIHRLAVMDQHSQRRVR